MARHLNHDIVVDKNTGKAKVMSQNISGGAPITRLQKGDIVTFSSTDPNSEIRYKDDPPNPPSLGTKQGSPFPGQLAPSRSPRSAWLSGRPRSACATAAGRPGSAGPLAGVRG